MVARPAEASSLELGDSIRVTYLPDGEIHLPHQPLYDGGTPELFLGNPQLLDADGLLVMSVGSILVETPEWNALIDLGVGPCRIDLEPILGVPSYMVGGDLLASLDSAGLGPGDIDVVLFTHLHADHIGWLTTDGPAGGAVTFGSAEHYVSEAELQHWLAVENFEAPAGPSAAQRHALAQLPLGTGQAIADERGVVRLLPTPGHTPGHTSYAVVSSSQRAVVLGDAMHCPLEITHSELALRGDVDIETGRRSRADLREELAVAATWTVGAHFPNSVFGRVAVEDGHSRYVPRAE